ncbi:MAG: hypothetical protein ABSA74_04020, partial [Candidatus Staskawiczbacteria bacterium]
YFANSTPAASTSAGPAQPALKNVALTSVINFAPPQTLPATQKNGNCFSSSVAAPFRQDAFRCMVDNSIYDPCFIVSEKGFVYCQEGIDASTGFLMKLTQDLPVVTPGVTVQTNWAWFLTLEDGTECSPFTGTRPIFNPGPNAQVAYYGCKSNDASQQIVLLGDLTQGNTWTANEAILTKTGGSGPWAIKSTKKVNITTVWQ